MPSLMLLTIFPPPLGAGSTEEEGKESARQLRPLVPKVIQEKAETQPIIRTGRKFTKKEEQLAELAESMGFQIVNTAKMKGELATAIAARMTARTGDFVYQCAVFTLTNMTRWFLDSVLPPEAVAFDTGTMKRWSMLNAAAVNNFLGPFLAAHQEGYTCAGSSRALKTEQHPWVRVIATCYQMHVDFFDMKNADKTSISITYALVDQHGEVHPPKDAKRLEILIEPAQMASIRQQAMSDLVSFQQEGAPLSGGFLRQLGLIDAAMVVEAQQANMTALSSASPASARGRSKKRKSVTVNDSQMWKVAAIVGA